MDRATVVTALARAALVAALVAALACGEKRAPETNESSSSSSSSPVLPRVTDDASTLLFSFVGEDGSVATATRVSDVPEYAQKRVLVVDLAKTPEERQAHKVALFTDLTQKNADGSYPVVVVSRYDAAKGESAQMPLPPVAPGTVIVYSAVWCGYCKKAKEWLADKGVPFVERDVERMAGAQAELDEKLKTAGVRGGGVPVIDWGGEIILGFDVPKLEARLSTK